ncbi:DMT family transporter [Pseudomonas sp. MAP12]|uniref:DMT family transporter n=1 Tax=Geopseudomonas aromaticivorans TaxID=2849492 RepID=A0ABS6MX50_9GAMM|nr:DMT family transporter [Pseudomonas aromaticivorans]MBV2133371.1 DMT family transporter [Pseudomonas aromaticivorans]
MNLRHSWAAAGLVLSCLCWAGNALVARAVADSIPPMALAFWRWSLALAILLPFVAGPLWQQRAVVRAAGWRLWLVAGLGIASYNSLLYHAAHSTSAINITLLNTCLPLATFLGAGVLLGEWPARRAWFGMALAACGLLLLIGRGDLATFRALDFYRGDLLMLLAVLAWALYSLLMRLWAPRLALPPLALLGVMILFGLLLMLPLYLLELIRSGGFMVTPLNVAAIGYTALFASLLAYLSWNHGLKVLGAARASLFSYLMPVFAALLGWLLLGERLAFYHWLGGALIFAGLLLATRPAVTKTVASS